MAYVDGYRACFESNECEWISDAGAAMAPQVAGVGVEKEVSSQMVEGS